MITWVEHGEKNNQWACGGPLCILAAVSLTWVCSANWSHSLIVTHNRYFSSKIEKFLRFRPWCFSWAERLFGVTLPSSSPCCCRSCCRQAPPPQIIHRSMAVRSRCCFSSRAVKTYGFLESCLCRCRRCHCCGRPFPSPAKPVCSSNHWLHHIYVDVTVWRACWIAFTLTCFVVVLPRA